MGQRLTEGYLKKQPALPEGVQQKIHRDAEPGFFVVQGRRKWTFAVKHGGRQHTVGYWPRMDVTAARAKALAIKAGAFDEPDTEPTGPTLAKAWRDYLDMLHHKNRSPRTIGNYDDLVNRVLKDWLDVPLVTLAENPGMAKKKHMAITRKGKPTIANHAMRALRAVYKYALRENRSLPSFDPTSAVDWNEENSNKTIVKDLAKWSERLSTIENGVRREFHLFMLLSGSRPDALTRALWEHLDVKRRLLHFPDPKGGTKRAFDMPLSRPMLACLARCRRDARFRYPGNDEWIFPADSASGHISEWKEPKVLGKEVGRMLRKTYSTIARSVTGEEHTVGRLLNHSQKTVTSRYIDYKDDALHQGLVNAQEDISKEIFRELAIPGARQRALMP